MLFDLIKILLSMGIYFRGQEREVDWVHAWFGFDAELVLEGLGCLWTANPFHANICCSVFARRGNFKREKKEREEKKERKK